MFFFLHTPFDFHIFFSHFFFSFIIFLSLTFHIYTVSQSVSFFSIFFLFPERFFFYFAPNQQALKHWCWAREKEIDTHGRRESKKVEKKKMIVKYLYFQLVLSNSISSNEKLFFFLFSYFFFEIFLFFIALPNVEQKISSYSLYNGSEN